MGKTREERATTQVRAGTITADIAYRDVTIKWCCDGTYNLSRKGDANVGNPLISLDLHRRTILDCLAILMIIGGGVAVGLALWLLYPTDEHPRWPGTDVIAAGGTAAAVGGILLGIGGNRDDHVVRKKARDEQEKDPRPK